jgi:zinc-finger of a C2HC-type
MSAVEKPRALICYICGRQFGTASLEIHIKSCQQKWEAEQLQKPLNKRKPLPKPPSDIKEMVITAKKNSNAIDAFNSMAFDTYNKALEQCPNCPRTFNPDSLLKHLKVCKGPEKMEPVKIPQRPKTLICYICGREYGTASLEIHLKACRKKWDVDQEKKPLG